MALLLSIIRCCSCFLLLNVILSTPVNGQHPADSGPFSTEQEKIQQLKAENTRLIFPRDQDGQITGFTAEYEGLSYTTTKIE